MLYQPTPVSVVIAPTDATLITLPTPSPSPSDHPAFHAACTNASGPHWFTITVFCARGQSMPTRSP